MTYTIEYDGLYVIYLNGYRITERASKRRAVKRVEQLKWQDAEKVRINAELKAEGWQ